MMDLLTAASLLLSNGRMRVVHDLGSDEATVIAVDNTKATPILIGYTLDGRLVEAPIDLAQPVPEDGAA